VNSVEAKRLLAVVGLGGCCASCDEGKPCDSEAGVGAVGDTLEAGDYHIVGTSVQFRDSPSGAGGIKGTFQNGEGIYLFGDIISDPSYMIGAGGAIVLNDGNHPGVDFARAGTQTFGPGWVAVRFTAPGSGMAKVEPKVVVEPKPVVVVVPQPKPVEKSIMPWVLGGSVIVLGIGAVALLMRARTT